MLYARHAAQEKLCSLSTHSDSRVVLS